MNFKRPLLWDIMRFLLLFIQSEWKRDVCFSAPSFDGILHSNPRENEKGSVDYWTHKRSSGYFYRNWIMNNNILANVLRFLPLLCPHFLLLYFRVIVRATLNKTKKFSSNFWRHYSVLLLLLLSEVNRGLGFAFRRMTITKIEING